MQFGARPYERAHQPKQHDEAQLTQVFSGATLTVLGVGWATAVRDLADLCRKFTNVWFRDMFKNGRFWKPMSARNCRL